MLFRLRIVPLRVAANPRVVVVVGSQVLDDEDVLGVRLEELGDIITVVLVDITQCMIPKVTEMWINVNKTLT